MNTFLSCAAIETRHAIIRIFLAKTFFHRSLLECKALGLTCQPKRQLIISIQLILSNSRLCNTESLCFSLIIKECSPSLAQDLQGYQDSSCLATTSAMYDPHISNNRSSANLFQLGQWAAVLLTLSNNRDFFQHHLFLPYYQIWHKDLHYLVQGPQLPSQGCCPTGCLFSLCKGQIQCYTRWV